MLSFGCGQRVISLGMLLVLTGCASGASNWTKPSLDADQRAADFSDCQGDTRQATQKDYAIDQDISASRGYDWHNQGVYNQQTTNLTSGAAQKSDSILAACMMSKGYASVE